MAKCSKCGKSVSDGVKFCPDCGARVKENKNRQTNIKWVWIISLILSSLCVMSIVLDVYNNYFGLNPYLIAVLIIVILTLIFSLVILILKFIKGYPYVYLIPFVLSLFASITSIMNGIRSIQIIGIFLWIALSIFSVVMLIKK